jgi:hypothetical protein
MDPRINDSRVRIVTYNETCFSVEWKNLLVRGAPHLGKFTFGASLHKNGNIIFVYEEVYSQLLLGSAKQFLN